MIFPDVTSTVGGTPLVELGRLAGGLPGRVVAKLEMRNPCGSVKDRLGLALIDDAERRGIQRFPDGTLWNVEFAPGDVDFVDKERLRTERIPDFANSGDTTARFTTFELLS